MQTSFGSHKIMEVLPFREKPEDKLKHVQAAQDLVGTDGGGGTLGVEQAHDGLDDFLE